MEDVEKYDSFLAKSQYLDSPQQPNLQVLKQNSKTKDKRNTAMFGGAEIQNNLARQLRRPEPYIENSDVMSNDSSDQAQSVLDFSISFMRSQTEYFHRFVRFNNVDSER